MPEAVEGSPEVVQARACIVGGGPAGMMLGLLLARAGVDVIVLEKHGDFLRDFRGDTVHPSTLEVLYELGILEKFLERPHQKVHQVRANVEEFEAILGDFSTLSTHCKFVALMPQWDFLDFLAGEARRYPGFHLRMQAEVTDLIEQQGTIVGVRAMTPHGALEVHARLVIGADGRTSTVRGKAGLVVEELGAPIDVLWLRVSRRPGDPGQLVGRFKNGKALAMIDRGDYWQCGYIIRKGGIEDIRNEGLPAFRASLLEIAPFLQDRVEELVDWDHIKLLTVKVDRLRTWYRPGLLCIGDAAHAMSPVGGIGINLAIQDAVAAGNILAGPLRSDTLTVEDLHRVQKRRMLPTRLTQRLQVFAQDQILSRAIGQPSTSTKPPLVLRIARRFPIIRRIPARIVGIGFRPEHVRVPEARDR